MRLVKAGVIAFSLAAAPALHASENSFALSLMVNDFTWEENLPGLSLEENGPLIGLHAQGQVKMAPSLVSFLYGELYAGTVDYDGFLIGLDGLVTPYKSETTYAGFSGAWDLGYDLLGEKPVHVYPFAGLGMHYWLRSLDDDGGYGYDEYWLTMYGRVGLRVHWMANSNTEFYASGALIAPFYNYEEAVGIPLAGGDDDVELEPKEELGFQVEAGMNYQRLHLSVFHESMTFGQSDLDDSGQFFQPESTREVTGVRAGLRF